ncbi:MAG: aminotransferase class V-fold PLP-dependent enzyme, partial [Myxococcales bacterium]|nr:aminotransferase class V-fold PLP-dependent enzyme [Myxococcales bacterium]
MAAASPPTPPAPPEGGSSFVPGTRGDFPLDPSLVFLNHGSFGSCPAPVRAYQRAISDRLERDPVLFFLRDLEPLLDETRAVLGKLVGAAPSDLGFVPNATHGTNAVLACYPLEAGDEIVITNHGYNAVNNAARRWAELRGGRVTVSSFPFPIASADEVVSAIEASLGPRTRLVIVDHVTSPSGLVLPVGRIVEACNRRGIDVLVDGAHAPGMLDLDVGALGAAFYTGNLHKWVCAPKGAAFLWVRADKQASFMPLVTSHGRNSQRTGRSLFLQELDWMGTDDPSAHLSVPTALAYLATLHDDGLAGVMRENHALALAAQARL